jgi:glycerophosphoryl diester phosphodiesterase
MDEGDEEAPRGRRIGKGWRNALIGLAAASVLLSVTNASWIAAQPPGRLIVVARHGVSQQFAPGSGCEAKRMRPDPENVYIENTLPSIYKAARLGADAVEIDVQASADGQAIVFRDTDLGCRTDGAGPLKAKTLAELKRLDVAYGYSADGGRTFPLRGRAVGGMPTVEEVLREVPKSELIFRFVDDDPAIAEAVVAALRRLRSGSASRAARRSPPGCASSFRGHGPSRSAPPAPASPTMRGWAGRATSPPRAAARPLR